MNYLISLIACIVYTAITVKTRSTLDYTILAGLYLTNILLLSMITADKIILELSKLH